MASCTRSCALQRKISVAASPSMIRLPLQLKALEVVKPTLSVTSQAVEQVIFWEGIRDRRLGGWVIIIVATCSLPIVFNRRVCCTAPCIVSITSVHTLSMHTLPQLGLAVFRYRKMLKATFWPWRPCATVSSTTYKN